MPRARLRLPGGSAYPAARRRPRLPCGPKLPMAPAVPPTPMLCASAASCPPAATRASRSSSQGLGPALARARASASSPPDTEPRCHALWAAAICLRMSLTTPPMLCRGAGLAPCMGVAGLAAIKAPSPEGTGGLTVLLQRACCLCPDPSQHCWGLGHLMRGSVGAPREGLTGPSTPIRPTLVSCPALCNRCCSAAATPPPSPASLLPPSLALRPSALTPRISCRRSRPLSTFAWAFFRKVLRGGASRCAGGLSASTTCDVCAGYACHVIGPFFSWPDALSAARQQLL
jgi:hypothetical protein